MQNNTAPRVNIRSPVHCRFVYICHHILMFSLIWWMTSLKSLASGQIKMHRRKGTITFLKIWKINIHFTYFFLFLWLENTILLILFSVCISLKTLQYLIIFCQHENFARFQWISVYAPTVSFFFSGKCGRYNEWRLWMRNLRA